MLRLFITVIPIALLLLSITASGSNEPRTAAPKHKSVPAATINKKKINPIKIPDTSCIVNVVEGDSFELDSLIIKCLNHRHWLMISVDNKTENKF